jgi:filamentous hemagglutinin family protein
MAKRVFPRTPARPAAPSGIPARNWLLRTTALLPIAFGAAGAWAQSAITPNTGPTGGQVVAGQASIATAPNRTTITQTTNRGVIDWQRFNVGSQHTVQFQQPNAGSWTLNRVVTSDPSVIAGRIQANGGVAIVNQSGIVFGQGAQVDVGSLIASAPGITNENFMAGRMRFDQAARPGARVENRGRITVPDRGIAVLAGPRVTNSGEIHARLGRVVLAGAETYALDLAGDGLLSIDITQAVRGDGAAIVTNEGVIEANGGSVLLTASAAGDLVEGLVRNTGSISANTEAGRTGEVALRASGGGVEVAGTVTATGGAGQQGGRIAVQSGESVRVAAGAVLDASGAAGSGTVLVGTTGVGRNQTMARRTTVERGATISADATVLGQGGTIAINSTEMTVVEGRLTARGGPQGGDGGLIELSGQGRMTLHATWDASAPAGRAGSLLLDPVRIEVNDVSNPGQTIPGTGDTIIATDGQGNNTLQLNAGQLSTSTGNIILEAQLGIRITSAVTKAQGDLTLRTTAAAGTSGLDGISIEAPVSLTAGSFAASTAGTFTIASTGSVTATGPSIQIDATGGINLSGALVGFNVTLNASGDIAQTADGLISAGRLTARATSATPDSPSLHLDQANNFILELDARADGTIAVTRAAGDTRPLTVLQAVAGGDISLLANTGFSLLIPGASDGGSGIASGSNVTLRGDSITVNNTVTGGTTADAVVALELREGGALTGDGAITANAGTVRIGAADGAHDFLIADGAAADGIFVSAATLGQVSAATLAIGLDAGGSVTASGIAVTAAVTATNAIRMDATGAIQIGADVTGDSISIASSAGAITQSAGAITTTGALIFQSDGAVSQTGGTIAASSLNVLGATGGTTAAASVYLGQSGNAITALDQMRATGGITIHGGSGTLSIGTGANVIGANVTLIATGGITQTAGSISAGTGALAFRSDGAIGQSGGTITAGSLSTLGAADGTTAAASVNIGQSGNAIAALDQVRATGDITIQAGAGTLAIGTGAAVHGANITLTAAGDITQTGGAINAGSGAGTLTLQSDGAVGQTGGTIAAGSLSVLGAAGGTTAAASITLDRSGNAIAALDQVRATGDIAIHAGADTLAIGAGATILGANITLTATGDITQTGGAINAGSGAGILTLQSDGAVGQTGGAISAGSLNVRSTPDGTGEAASISLDRPGNAIAALGEVLAIGDITIQAGTGTLTIGSGASVSGANITLIATGGITQTGGVINAGSGALTLQSDGAVGQTGGTITAASLSVLGAAGGTNPAASVSVDQSGNAIDAIGQIRVTGDITIHAGTGTNPFSIGAIATTTGNIALSAARAVEVTGAVSGVNLTITGTAITVGATGQVTATGGDLILNATSGSGGITLDAGSSLTGASGHRVVLRADALSIDAGATLTLTGTAVEAGPQTADLAVLLGTAGSGLSLDVAILGRLTGSGATTLRFGETTIGADTQRGGDLTLGSSLSFASGDLTLVSEGAVALGTYAITTAGHSLHIHADGVVSGSGTLQAASLVIRGATGGSNSAADAIILDGANNAVGILDARSSGDVIFANTGAGLTVRQARGASVAIDALGQTVSVEAGGAGIVADDDVSLRAASITLGAGITAGSGQTLSLQIASGGTITGAGTLSANGGTIEIGAAATGAALTVGAAGIAAPVLNAAQTDTIVVGRSSFNGGAAITADSVTVSDAVAVMASVGTLSFRAGGDVILNAAVSTGSNRSVTLDAGRDIVQTAAGLITTGRLDANAGRDILLHAGDPGRTILGTWNQIATLGNMTAGGNLVLNANGALSITGNLLAANATIAAKGALSLGSTATITTIGGTAQLAAGGAVTLAGVIDAGSGGTVTIGSSSTIIQTSGSITAGTFGASGTTIDLSGGAGNSLGALALRAATGDLAFDTDGTLTLAGTVTVAIIGGTDAFGGLSAAGDLSVSAGTIIGGAGTVFQAGAGHSITLRANTLSLDSNTTIGAQGGGALASLSIGPRTDGRTMILGDTDVAGTLTLSDGTMTRLLGVDTQLLQLGRTVVGSPVLAGDIVVQSALSANGRLALAGNGNITLAQTLTTVAGDIELVAGGGISQTAAGGLAPGSGLLVASAGGDIDLRNGNNSLNALAAESSTGAVFVTIANTGITLTTGSGSVTGLDGPTHAVVGVSAATQVFLQAAAITIAAAAPVTAGNLATPGSVTLRTDSLDVQGTVQAPGGTVAIEPLTLTALPQIQLGGTENASTLWVSNDELERITAATLVFGRSDGSGNTRDIRISESGANWSGALRLIGDDVTIAGTLAPSSLALWVSGTVSDFEVAGAVNIGTVNTPSLTLRGLAGGETDGGSIDLSGRYQNIDALDIRSSGTVTLFLDPDTGAVQANQLRGVSVSLVVDGDITVAGGGATTTNGNLTLQTAGSLSIDGALSVTGGNLTLSGTTVTSTANGDATATGLAQITATGAGGATLDGDITAGTITLTANNGTLTTNGMMQAAGGMMMSAATVVLNGSATVSGGNLTVTGGTIVAAATGALSASGTTQITASGGGGATLDGSVTGGSVILTTPAGTMTITGVMQATAGNLTISGRSVSIAATGDATATGLTQVTATAGNATLNGDITAGAITLSATGDMHVGGVMQANAGDLSITGGTVSLDHDLTVTNGAAFITVTAGDATLDGSITAQAITLSATGAMTVGGTLQATAGNLTITGGSVTLTSNLTVANGVASITATAGNATLSGGIAAQAVMLASSGDMMVNGAVEATIGGAALTATAGDIAVNGAVTAAGNVVIDAGHALALAADVTAASTGSVTLNAGTVGIINAAYTITQTAGVIGGAGGTGTALVVNSRSGNAGLNQANRIATLNAISAGELSVTAAGGLTVLQASAAGQTTLRAAALSLTGAVSAGAGGTVHLVTTTGGVSQTGSGIVTAQILTGDVAGDVALAAAPNAVATTGAFTFGGNFALSTSGHLTVAQALTANPGKTITLQAGGNLVLPASIRADTVSLAATTGSIDQTGGVIAAVTPGARTILAATAGAGVALASAANDVGTLVGGSGGSGGFLLRNNGDLMVAGLVQAGGATTLHLDAAGTITLAASGSLSATSGTVLLTADGAVTLAGTINAANAFITTASTLQQIGGGIATTGVLAARATDINLQSAGNAISQLAAEATAGNLAVASAGTMAIGSGTPPGGGPITGVSGNTVFLTAGGLNINQAVTAAPGSTVTLRAGSMNIAAAVSASGGTVLLEQATPGGSISLGAESPAALSLSTTELAQVNANLLVIGSGSGQIIVAGDVAAPSAIGTLRLLGSGIAVNALLAGPAGGVTDLHALSGDITTVGSGRVAGSRLQAYAAGNVALTGANDFIQVTGSAPGGFIYRDGNSFAVAAPGIQAGSVSLSTDAGNITQQAGAAIVTGTLDARAAAGSVLLDGGSATSAGADLNRVGAVTRLVASSGGLALLRNAHGLDMAGLADNGAGGALGTLRLFAASGNITQSAGLLRVARLEAETPGGSLLLGQANGIASLGGIRVAGDLVVTNDSSLILAAPIDVGSFGGGSSGIALLTVNNGNLLQTAGARLSADRLAANALTGSVLLDGGGSTNPADLLRVANLVDGYAAQSMVLRFGNAVTVTGLMQTGATSGTPTGTLALEAPGITIGGPGQGGTLLRAGTVVLRTQADFDGPAIPGSGSIVQQGGAIQTVNLAASAPDGDVLLGFTSNRFNALAPGSSANGAASAHSLIAGGSIDIAEGGPGFVVLGGLQNDGSGIQLRSLGDLTFNAATSVSGAIDLSAAGTVTIGTAADLRSDTLLTLNGGAGIAVQGAVTAPDILANTGGTFTLTDSGRITGGGGPGGSVSVTAGHIETSGGAISAHDVTLQSGTGNIVNTSFAAQNLVNIQARGALRVAGIGVDADAMQARTGGLLTLSGGSYTIGSVVVFAGSAGINTEGTVQVRPRTPGRFPAIVLDSRAPGTQPDPLTVARPDVTGLAPDLQETQVRLPNADAPGDFGAASGAPAGAIHFSLDAGQSPLFLLIDGGSATGTVNTSGRIGIHGRGGAVEITGTLIDPSGQRIEGQAAARMTDATRPATGTEISRFRINDCVVSSFNCVVPAQVIVVPTAAPVPPPLIYGGVGRDPDAVSPNVSEEWTAPDDDEEEEDDKR